MCRPKKEPMCPMCRAKASTWTAAPKPAGFVPSKVSVSLFLLRASLSGSAHASVPRLGLFGVCEAELCEKEAHRREVEGDGRLAALDTLLSPLSVRFRCPVLSTESLTGEKLRFPPSRAPATTAPERPSHVWRFLETVLNERPEKSGETQKRAHSREQNARLRGSEESKLEMRLISMS
uniref:Uncharacterized protein n=1 Tax=Toxoplasma gondii COUG TaxID=1074873 RepID=A0A2G8Y2W2_TOXGO|nr:hypothetical protein TGCOUG_392960 [Toxoplasma gondii COUG]